MNRSCWSTSAFARADEAPSSQTSTLGEHLGLCRAVGGRLFAWRCGVEAVHRFVAARFVTSLLVATALIGASLLAF
jgi:hypothetical protein